MQFRFLGFQFRAWNDNCGFLYKDPKARKGFWIRFLGRGFHISNLELTYSERNGYKKFIKLPRGYKFKFLDKEWK